MAIQRIHACLDCRKSFVPNNWRHARCTSCRTDGYGAKLRLKAHAKVAAAITRGQLANLKEHNVGCVDCGSRADRYDHRDYTLPLMVDPVCRQCDGKRGPVSCPNPANELRKTA